MPVSTLRKPAEGQPQRTRRRYGLHVVVYFHGEPVEDRVLRFATDTQVLGAEGVILLPPPHDAGHAALVRWSPRRSEAYVDIEDHTGAINRLRPGDDLTLSQPGLDIAFQLIPQYRLARPPLIGEGDIGFAVAILAMAVLVLQLQLIGQFLNSLPGAAPAVPDPSPELIARLLEEDLEGAEIGYIAEPKPREAQEKQVDSFFMPSGNEGPKDNAGGSANVDDERVRTENTEKPELPSFQPLRPDDPQPELAVNDGQDIEAPVPGVTDPQNLRASDIQQEETVEDLEVAAEEQEGWGFYDWYDAEDARRDAEEIRQEILMSRQRLALDPDDPWALQNLGYFQYLAQDYGSCRRTYERFIELNPDEAAGYNNLALVYKRTGEYGKEEGYYRLALALDDKDDHALNNLAVNLAHQGRYGEALEIMQELETLIPGDAYAELHRSKIYAAMGNDAEALRYLELALKGMAALDTLHHIEFRQDIRVDPAFSEIRETDAFDDLLAQYYGEDAAPLLGGQGGKSG